MSARAKKIIKAALDGVIESQREYEGWSNEWLWMAPEYLTTVFVGKTIADAIGGKQLTLEHGTRSAMKDAGAAGRGKLHREIRENGRFDLLVWNREGLPTVPIEVKVQVTNAQTVLADVNRIAKVISRKQECSSFQFGMVVYYISLCDDKSGKRKARDKIEARLKTILDDVKKNISSPVNVNQETSEIFVDYKYNSAWAAAALIIEPATRCK